MEPWHQNEAFRSMEPAKQKMIEQLAASLQGKKLTEALPLLMQWKQTMQRENKSFLRSSHRSRKDNLNLLRIPLFIKI